MTAIYLHGALGERFGTRYELAVASPAEAMRALSVQLKGFRKAITEGIFRLIHGPLDGGVALGEDELRLGLGRHPLHVVPVIAGAGLGGDIGKIVGGLAIAAAAFFLFPGIPVIGALVSHAGIAIGTSLALGGVSSLLTSKPVAANDRGGVDERASFIFDGPQNVDAQGGCVPCVFGRMLVGSVVVSAGLSAEQDAS